MKPRKPTAAEKLQIEADHFRLKAMELTMEVLLRPDPEKERRAREHWIRAETFRAAGKLAGKCGTVNREP